MSLAAQLAGGLEVLGLILPPETQIHLLQHLALIQKWNRVHNLTAVREPETMLVRHLLDSLAVLPHVSGPRIADIGSGAGLPGIPLALARPEWYVTLVESSHKKAVFLQQARIELKLKNVEVVNERVENFHPKDGFDLVISRAFSDLGDFIRLAGHLCIPGSGGGRLVAMKGVYPHEELAQLPAQFIVEKILPVAIPGLEAERHLVIIRRAS
ncbi:16S rRNA (guanine(527)-N(7))-methyltransferase RsmG [Nitrosovibrio sp. Nv6]|uniref:16S rRNA (guanine(527)-N(7))-methyltransferase RsmG n=1 Tax=Nitrosovibrio sp. Nv6 TaxID=1855340 RepID=UPI0008D5B72A|nr:16S rRNA (guanine(527)-N(7))-methyltransferase RsmG [Nitrosovibrio sp. Nv6]SEP37917.1 16S rRNA (guanine527-N7)-methyltransferase [Nitrosovibrio sp. Nv6]